MKRDNAYLLHRLQRDGRDDLITRINSGEISVYAACVQAGLRRSKSTETRAEQLTYHWKRANAADRRRFVVDNFGSLAPIVNNLVKEIRASKEKMGSPSE